MMMKCDAGIAIRLYLFQFSFKHYVEKYVLRSNGISTIYFYLDNRYTQSHVSFDFVIRKKIKLLNNMQQCFIHPIISNRNYLVFFCCCRCKGNIEPQILPLIYLIKMLRLLTLRVLMYYVLLIIKVCIIYYLLSTLRYFNTDTYITIINTRYL